MAGPLTLGPADSSDGWLVAAAGSRLPTRRRQQLRDLPNTREPRTGRFAERSDTNAQPHRVGTDSPRSLPTRPHPRPHAFVRIRGPLDPRAGTTGWRPPTAGGSIVRRPARRAVPRGAVGRPAGDCGGLALWRARLSAYGALGLGSYWAPVPTRIGNRCACVQQAQNHPERESATARANHARPVNGRRPCRTEPSSGDEAVLDTVSHDRISYA